MTIRISFLKQNGLISKVYSQICLIGKNTRKVGQHLELDSLVQRLVEVGENTPCLEGEGYFLAGGVFYELKVNI